MKSIQLNFLSYAFLLCSIAIPGIAFSEQTTPGSDILSGYYSREGNNKHAAKTTNNNIYIKLYPEQWIAVLYIPYPYAANVKPGTINAVFKKVKHGSESGSFTRSTFDLLDEAATVHVEKYEAVKEQLQFKCGSVNPCAVRFYDTYLELVKSGIINEHIIKFDHVNK